MASKNYAYYLKGNKVAIVEKDVSAGSGTLSSAHCSISGHTTKDACEAAGGTWIPSSSGSIENYGEYKSPKESIDEGLEIEYAYAPTYNINANSTTVINNNTLGEGTGILAMFGWTEVDGYLAFANGTGTATSTYVDLSHSDWDEELGTNDEDYILIQGSSAWNGIHKIKRRDEDGFIVTHTKVLEKLSGLVVGKIDSTNIYFENTVASSSVLTDMGFNETGRAYYLMLDSTANANNEAIFKVTPTVVYAEGLKERMTIDGRMYTGLYSTEWKEAAAGTLTDVASNAYTGRRVIKDNCILYGKGAFDQLKDESFELDLTRGQARALIYFLKARLSEDALDIEGVEYFMRQFKRALEKSAGARKFGGNVIQGFWGMRRK